jgi:hypothetical protein
MTLVRIVLGGLGVVSGLFILAWINAIRASVARDRKLDDLIRPAIDAVRENRPVAQETVTELAGVAATRNHLFARLKAMGRADIFPAAYRSIEKVAESDLARWLMHPNELGAAPSDMELVRGIDVREQEKSGRVFLFRFRADASNWASNHGWMAGVAGPYWDNAEPLGTASGTFSELIPFDSLTAEQHVDVLRQALKKKGLVVPS